MDRKKRLLQIALAISLALPGLRAASGVDDDEDMRATKDLKTFAAAVADKVIAAKDKKPDERARIVVIICEAARGRGYYELEEEYSLRAVRTVWNKEEKVSALSEGHLVSRVLGVQEYLKTPALKYDQPTVEKFLATWQKVDAAIDRKYHPDDFRMVSFDDGLPWSEKKEEQRRSGQKKDEQFELRFVRKKLLPAIGAFIARCRLEGNLTAEDMSNLLKSYIAAEELRTRLSDAIERRVAEGHADGKGDLVLGEFDIPYPERPKSAGVMMESWEEYSQIRE